MPYEYFEKVVLVRIVQSVIFVFGDVIADGIVVFVVGFEAACKNVLKVRSFVENQVD